MMPNPIDYPNDLKHRTAVDLRNQVKGLQKQIEALEREAVIQREKDKDAVSRKWRFTLQPNTRPDTSWMAIRPGSGVTRYTLKGELLNRKELLEAGWHDSDVKGGSMDYLVNDLNGRIIKSDGGGTIYIADSFGMLGTREEREAEAVKTFTALEALIAAGETDCTNIILAQKTFAWRK
jgi:hypothetical protein